MLEGTMTPPCTRHPEQAAVARCGRCGEPFCEQCRVESLATEQVFCSKRCMAALHEIQGERKTVSNKALRAGLKKPIRTGWALWGRSVGPLVAAVLPLAVVSGSLWWYRARLVNADRPDGDVLAVTLTVVLLLVGAYGVALVGTLLSQRYTGLVHGNPHARAAGRLIPWLATWFLMIVVTLAGYVAFILPGIYLAIRLFWADEYALAHDKSPIAALKASWELTRKAATPVFVFQFVLGLAQYVVLVPTVIFLVATFAGLETLRSSTVDSFAFAEAFIFVFVGLVGYSAMHAPEVVQFYGMRAARASLGADELGRDDWLNREKNRLF